MNLASPKIYRIINNVALETDSKIETAIVLGCTTLKRSAPCLPLHWLSINAYALSRT
ncbi:hypothetical protein EDC96DRAFT_454738 [Choanephora cucurbitarum]|nr:hypothetical protein EDC96DRAFT_454738 [Choanephora cucurbitarum]